MKNPFTLETSLVEEVLHRLGYKPIYGLNHPLTIKNSDKFVGPTPPSNLMYALRELNYDRTIKNDNIYDHELLKLQLELRKYDISDAREKFFNLLHYGFQFYYSPLKHPKSYEIIRLVDRNIIRNNHFDFFRNYRGGHKDGFKWDFVITINELPVACILFQRTTKGHQPCEEAYKMMKKQLEGDLSFPTYLQLCVLSDGHNTVVGTPDMEFSQFAPWSSVDGEDNPEGLDVDSTVYAIFRPERLIDILMNYTSFVHDGANGYTTMLDCHCYFAVKKAMERIHDENIAIIGHIRLLEKDDRFYSQPEGQSKQVVNGIMTRCLTEGMNTYCDVLTVNHYLEDKERNRFIKKNRKFIIIAGARANPDDLRDICEQTDKARIISITYEPFDPLCLPIGPCLYAPAIPL